MENTITFTPEAEDGTITTASCKYKMGSLAGEEEVQLKQTAGQTDVSSQISLPDSGLYVILGNDSDDVDLCTIMMKWNDQRRSSADRISKPSAGI